MKSASFGSDLLLQIEGAVATIIIDRPAKRNALRLATWASIPHALAAAEDDPSIRLIVFRGAGQHFSAGNDIAELGALRGNPSAAEAFGAAMATATQAVESASLPVLMAIEGHCYGSAVALALAGDVRIVAANAVFAITPAKLGAVYLASDLHRLVAAIGAGASKKLLYAAEEIAAETAREIGLVDGVFAADRFATELNQLVDTILAGSPQTLLRTKKMLRAFGLGSIPRETSDSLAPFVEATQSSDFAEGTSAFLEKRRPRFWRPSLNTSED